MALALSCCLVQEIALDDGFVSSLPRAHAALEARPVLADTLERLVARAGLGFDNPLDYLVAVFCPALRPSLHRYYAAGGPPLAEIVRSKARLKALDRSILGLVDGLAYALQGQAALTGRALEDLVAALLARLGLDPFPRCAGGPPAAEGTETGEGEPSFGWR